MTNQLLSADVDMNFLHGFALILKNASITLKYKKNVADADD